MEVIIDFGEDMNILRILCIFGHKPKHYISGQRDLYRKTCSRCGCVLEEVIGQKVVEKQEEFKKKETEIRARTPVRPFNYA